MRLLVIPVIHDITEKEQKSPERGEETPPFQRTMNFNKKCF